ncbi:polyhydroxyalkanoate synthesis regulator DNA-binding domain-containing protein [Haloferula sp.]|uniref:polyhydroxyalkanoate synthesis regulator DNA-binding domain-containing protein n=1 Tax=Haloferula sp. TaxID=2497595 RepID=UPI003C71A4FE
MIEPLPFPSAAADVLEIRRYPNRRLYDATRSKAVTLDELHRLVVEGHRIQVTETATGEDITARILTQIILDLDIGKLAMFPEGLLHAVLQVNETVMTEFMDTHFHQALALFARSREQYETHWKQKMPSSDPQEWMKAWMAPFMQSVQAEPKAQDDDLAEVVKNLSKQVAEMQKEMAKQRQDDPAE